LRILFVNQFYWPDDAATAQVLSDLAEFAAARGHEVHVIASRATYAGLARRPLPPEEIRNHVRIHRVGATGFGRATVVRRLSDYLSFYGLAVLRAARLRRPDVVVTLTTPPMIGALGLLLRAARSVPHVVWLMDLYPDLAIRFGALRQESLVARLMGALSRTVLSRADGVIVLGDDMARIAASRGADAARLAVCRNWSDVIAPIAARTGRFRARLGIPSDAVVVGYSGNFGRGHRFESILEVVRRRREDPRVRFLFIGGGPLYATLRDTCTREGLVRAHFAGYQPRNELADTLGAIDVHLISQDPGVDGLLVPSKLYGILAAGRPALFLGSRACEVGATVLAGACGEVISPDDPLALDRAVEALVVDPERRAELGRRARETFEARFTREAGCARVLGAVERAVARSLEARAAVDATELAIARG
jgi:colanic acid biosynthesis glycosyl transferase WcaI